MLHFIKCFTPLTRIKLLWGVTSHHESWYETLLYSFVEQAAIFWVTPYTHTHIHISILTLTGLNNLISGSKIFFILFRENKIIPNPSKKLNQGQSAKASTSKPSKSQFTFIYMQGQQVHHVNFCNVCIAMEKNGFYPITGHSWKFWIGHQSKCGELERFSKRNPEHGYHPQFQGKYVSVLYIFLRSWSIMSYVGHLVVILH